MSVEAVQANASFNFNPLGTLVMIVIFALAIGGYVRWRKNHPKQ